MPVSVETNQIVKIAILMFFVIGIASYMLFYNPKTEEVTLQSKKSIFFKKRKIYQSPEYVEAPEEKDIKAPITPPTPPIENPVESNTKSSPDEERKIDYEKIVAGQILEERLGTAETKTINGIYGKREDKNKDKNWDKYGAVSEKASYPVDMSRVITEDMQIPCTLMTAIISVLPGKIRCQVSENIYGRNGNKLLIPAGSVAIGRYEGIQKIGQSRMAAKWHRITTDQGITILFDIPLESADKAGISGIGGELDNRSFEKYGGAIGLALLEGAASVAVAKNMEHGTTINQVQQGASQIGNAMLLENLDLVPILSVDPGKSILLDPQSDIWFQKSKNKIIVTSPVNLREVYRSASR